MRTTAPVSAIVAPCSPSGRLSRKPTIVSPMTTAEIRMSRGSAIRRSSSTSRRMSSGSSADTAARKSARKSHRANSR